MAGEETEGPVATFSHGKQKSGATRPSKNVETVVISDDTIGKDEFAVDLSDNENGAQEEDEEEGFDEIGEVDNDQAIEDDEMDFNDEEAQEYEEDPEADAEEDDREGYGLGEDEQSEDGEDGDDTLPHRDDTDGDDDEDGGNGKEFDSDALASIDSIQPGLAQSVQQAMDIMRLAKNLVRKQKENSTPATRGNQSGPKRALPVLSTRTTTISPLRQTHPATPTQRGPQKTGRLASSASTSTLADSRGVTKRAPGNKPSNPVPAPVHDPEKRKANAARLAKDAAEIAKRCREVSIDPFWSHW